MVQKLPFKRLLIVIGMALGLLLTPAGTIYAQSNAPQSDGLAVSPALVEVNGAKGKTYSVDLTVQNVTNSTLTFDSSVDDFGAKDETGAPSILIDSAQDLPTSIKSWVSNIPSFTLSAQQIRKLTANITIPSSAEPGGHYGVIRFSGRTPESTSTLGQVASAGTLILIDVDGQAKESLQLASLDVTKSGHSDAVFESGPLTFVSRFTNTGSVHVKPVGQIEVKDGFGKPIATLKVNDPEKGNVLPSSTRRFESTLDKQWLFGRYTADLSVGYGTTGQAITKTVSFWVIPYKLVGIALLLLITLIYVLRNVIKRYNKFIIASSNKPKKTNKRR